MRRRLMVLVLVFLILPLSSGVFAGGVGPIGDISVPDSPTRIVEISIPNALPLMQGGSPSEGVWVLERGKDYLLSATVSPGGAPQNRKVDFTVELDNGSQKYVVSSGYFTILASYAPPPTQNASSEVLSWKDGPGRGINVPSGEYALKLKTTDPTGTSENRMKLIVSGGADAEPPPPWLQKAGLCVQNRGQPSLLRVGTHMCDVSVADILVQRFTQPPPLAPGSEVWIALKNDQICQIKSNPAPLGKITPGWCNASFPDYKGHLGGHRTTPVEAGSSPFVYYWVCCKEEIN